MPLKLYERPNGIWHIRGTVQRRRVDESARTRVRAEAEAIRAQLEADLFKRSVYGDDAVATYAEAALAYMKAGGSKEHQKLLLQRIGLKKISEVTQGVVDDIAAERPNAAPATLVRQIYTPVGAVMNFAASDAGGRLCQPIKYRKPKVRNARTEFLTPKQAEAWLTGPDALKPYLGRLVTFYLGTGCRASEGIGQQGKDTTSDRAVFQDTKEDYARGVDLQARVKLALGEAVGADEHLFVNSRGEPWHGYDAVNLMLKRHQAKHPKLRPVHCHLFRHTWATWAYACTRDLTYLMQSGGWRSLSMVGRYTHLASPDLAREVLAHGWEFCGRELPGLKPKRPKPK